MMIPQREPLGRHMQPTGSMLARLSITTDVFVSTFRQLAPFASWTGGGCTLPIAKSLLHLNMTKPYLRRPTSLNHSDVRPRLQPAPSSSISPQFASSPRLCPASLMPHPPFLHLRGWRMPHHQGWRLQHLRGWNNIKHHHNTAHCPSVTYRAPTSDTTQQSLPNPDS
jgi:hypothetical protein